MWKLILGLLVSVYIPVHVQGPYAISGGDQSGSFPASAAFDGTAAAYWSSSQTGLNVSANAYIGFYFSRQEFTAPLRININQCNSANNSVASVLIELADPAGNWGAQYGPYSMTTGWNEINDDFLVGGIPYPEISGMRIRSAANLTGTNRWQVCEVIVSMIQPDAYQAPTSTPTPTPTITPTPSTTPTPSNTPTSTPDYYVVVTSTQGAAMAVQRTATFGEILVFAGLMAVFGILLISFAYQFWTNRRA